MRVFASVILAVSSALAYQVTYPGGTQGWTSTGPNVLKWDRVDTDPLNFTTVLTNDKTGYQQILDAFVVGALGNMTCSQPSGGWPTGTNFRVNLAQDLQHPNSLLAQSNEFSIVVVSPDGSTTTPVPSQTGTNSIATPSASTSGSATSTSPTAKSAALLGTDAKSSLFIAVAAFTALVAIL